MVRTVEDITVKVSPSGMYTSIRQDSDLILLRRENIPDMIDALASYLPDSDRDIHRR